MKASKTYTPGTIFEIEYETKNIPIKYHLIPTFGKDSKKHNGFLHLESGRVWKPNYSIQHLARVGVFTIDTISDSDKGVVSILKTKPTQMIDLNPKSKTLSTIAMICDISNITNSKFQQLAFLVLEEGTEGHLCQLIPISEMSTRQVLLLAEATINIL